jgi:hypothetical protein
MFYAQLVINVFLHKRFHLDVKLPTQPQHRGEPNTNISGLQFVHVQSEETTYDIIEDIIDVVEISLEKFNYFSNHNIDVLVCTCFASPALNINLINNHSIYTCDSYHYTSSTT